MRFEVEIERNEAGEWTAIAVEHDVKATGRTEKEALALLMDALVVHFKKAGAGKKAGASLGKADARG
jgi:predicted RNase H-like HicB family nuclease